MQLYYILCQHSTASASLSWRYPCSAADESQQMEAWHIATDGTIHWQSSCIALKTQNSACLAQSPKTLDSQTQTVLACFKK